MARIRTARVIAAAASVPLAFAVLGGVAQADNGAFADDGSASNAQSSVSVQGQNAEGDGNNTNSANNATVNGNGAVVDQSNETTNTTVDYVVVFGNTFG
ncbi:hypothetical protein [Streptomyces boncukensis]|uniref:Secreted protein n=1 Tax=Streptomyces boncukensis TaxID=2711219 RepID=A0A6G4X949_9ACTN|nr:hypothetical protein [Streptomyces boncukensis]NGO73908.1 hypothetical protein [Streptomyces boncukensis]